MSDIESTNPAPAKPSVSLDEVLRTEAHAFHLAQLENADIIETNEYDLDELPLNWRLNTIFEDGQYEVSTLSELIDEGEEEVESQRAMSLSYGGETYELVAEEDSLYRRTPEGWQKWDLPQWAHAIIAEEDLDAEDPDALPLQRRLSAFYDDSRVERANDLSELIDSDGDEGFVSQERLPFELTHDGETYELITEDGQIYRRVGGYWHQWEVPKWAIELAAQDEDEEEN